MLHSSNAWQRLKWKESLVSAEQGIFKITNPVTANRQKKGIYFAQTNKKHVYCIYI